MTEAARPRSTCRVLLALRGERAPLRTLREAQRFASALGGELHVIRVVPMAAPLSAASPSRLVQALRDAHRVIAAARHTRKLCDRVLGEPLPIAQLSVRLGSFINQVALRAAELGAMTIAVAPSRRRFGAAVMRLARRTGCAVLVPRGRGARLTVLAAIDRLDENPSVLRQAAYLAAALDATRATVRSVAAAAAASPEVLEARQQALERATPTPGQVVVCTRDPAQGILEQARASEAGLIILGLRSERDPAACSGIAAGVIQQARGSVLVAPSAWNPAPASAL